MLNLNLYTKIGLWMALLFGTNLVFGQTTIYVDINATGASDGSSWNDAYANLKTALQSANSGDEVWIADGIYTLPTPGNNQAFEIQAGLHIYGGFQGNETSLSQRQWKQFPTVLSGDINGNDNNILRFDEPTRSDNTYAAVRVTGSNVILDGLVIEGGNADLGPGNVFGRGGSGIFVDEFVGDLTIRNCKIQKNTGHMDVGLRFRTKTTSTLIVEHCEFVENTSRSATALIVTTETGGDMSFYMRNTIIHKNEVLSQGSEPGLAGSAGLIGIGLSANGTSFFASIDNCTFTQNKELGTNGYENVFCVGSLSNGLMDVSFNNCIFYDNISAAKAIDNQHWGTVSSLTLNNTIVEDAPNVQATYATSVTLNNVQNIDPLFVNAATCDYNLQCNSPAINAGDTVGLVLNSTDWNGAERIKGGNIDIGAMESQGGGDIMANATELCSGSAANLTVMGLSSYSWSGGVVNGVDFYPSTTTTYTVTGMDSSGCNYVDSITIHIIEIDDSVSSQGITLVANDMNASYQWMDCGTNQIIPGETNATYTPTVSGNYAVVLTYNGCTVISPCQNVVVNGLEGVRKSMNLLCYPNPTTEFLNIDFGQSYEQVTVEVMNQLGQLVQQKEYQFEQFCQLTLKETGVYFIKIRAITGEENCIKIIRQ